MAPATGRGALGGPEPPAFAFAEQHIVLVGVDPGIDQIGNLAQWYQDFNPQFKGSLKQGPASYVKWVTPAMLARVKAKAQQ